MLWHGSTLRPGTKATGSTSAQISIASWFARSRVRLPAGWCAACAWATRCGRARGWGSSDWDPARTCTCPWKVRSKFDPATGFTGEVRSWRSCLKRGTDLTHDPHCGGQRQRRYGQDHSRDESSTSSRPQMLRAPSRLRCGSAQCRVVSQAPHRSGGGGYGSRTNR